MTSVVHVDRAPYLCLADAVKAIKGKMEHHGANRLVLGTCAPFISRRLASDIGVDPSLIQVVNLREEVAWSNRSNPAAATAKARALVRMAVERLRLQEPVPLSSVVTTRSALVIGGGLAGMVAAQSIAGMGHEVHLLEREAELGGGARDMHSTLEGTDVQALLKKTIQDVETNPLIHVYRDAQVVGVEGYAGHFKVKFAARDDARSVLEAGSIVVATGADKLKTTEYLHGQNEKVITQDELEQKIAAGQLGDVKSVAMIQCVGSRDESRPYCSRFCCSQALMNAIRVKEINPAAQVVVFYRDLMSYGFTEKYYLLRQGEGRAVRAIRPGKQAGGEGRGRPAEGHGQGTGGGRPDHRGARLAGALDAGGAARRKAAGRASVGGFRRGWLLQGGRGEVPAGGLPEGRDLPVRTGALAPEPGRIHPAGPGGGPEGVVHPGQEQADLRPDGIRGQAEVLCRMRDVHHRVPLRGPDKR